MPIVTHRLSGGEINIFRFIPAGPNVPRIASHCTRTHITRDRSWALQLSLRTIGQVECDPALARGPQRLPGGVMATSREAKETATAAVTNSASADNQTPVLHRAVDRVDVMLKQPSLAP